MNPMSTALISAVVICVLASQAQAGVFAVVEIRGTRYELSDEPVSSCVKLPSYASGEWKVAWVSGRWMGRVKSCWQLFHNKKQKVNQGSKEEPYWTTIPAYDDAWICLPFVKEKGENGMSPSCQSIDTDVFIAVSSLPKKAF